ncbi:cell division suppressor protein YneA [Alteribacter populi]|uniref:cell division suppressor protein YneA n=1 Tax=Alteribacter populi TaxID=2011011 RepID=UPI000BBA9CF4|nr:LysM peptidoglycan-binding domain-containing protein [Alteribacter populi]
MNRFIKPNQSIKISHIITAMIILLFIVVTTIPVDSKGLEGYERSTIVVSEGDTLWSIAADLHEELNTNKETVINWIKGQNELEETVIITGQSLTVPIKKGEN